MKTHCLKCYSQENQLARRHDSQKIAAFNLGVSEAIKAKGAMRDTDFHVSSDIGRY